MSQLLRVQQVRVAVHAPDPVTRAGLASHLRSDSRLAEVPQEEVEGADVTVVAMDTVDGSTLGLLSSLRGDGQPLFALVVGRRWQADLYAAVDQGVRAVVWRDTFTPEIFARTLLTVAEGGGSFPPALQGTFMRQVQWTHREVLTPLGLTASGVSPREQDVLRLLAEGQGLAEIAEKLSYSERTVKYVLHGLMKRMNLNNRAHAVSYAIRSGLI
jgi:DNA-binding NarL/FixJ family response regulator